MLNRMYKYFKDRKRKQKNENFSTNHKRTYDV